MCNVKLVLSVALFALTWSLVDVATLVRLYDQRQEGKYNWQTKFKNLLGVAIIEIPSKAPSITDLSLFGDALSSLELRNVDSRNNLKEGSAEAAAAVNRVAFSLFIPSPSRFLFLLHKA